ncbi:hypothetical protein HU200_029162 [Digitaria exilis]|uniref:Uncharacterized protein n=1 Tax=Digitaria exilis TaxID=1010633 RepID=A0A835BTF6_9POAL|nr:hypothetical protein HU200_029162 [Digitaria exilis]
MNRTKGKLSGILHKGFKPDKCKKSLRITVSRIKLVRNRKEVQVRQMRREVARLLETNQDITARIIVRAFFMLFPRNLLPSALHHPIDLSFPPRHWFEVEDVIREEKFMQAYELIELYCELIVARLPIIDAQKSCPIDLREAIASVIFASMRCSDIIELEDVRKHFTSKYGKDFAAAALEVRPDSGVNRLVIEKLSGGAPDVQTKIKTLTSIAEEHNIKWGPKAFEVQESLGLDHHSGGGLPRDIPFHLLEEIADYLSNKCKLGSGEDGPRIETQEVAEQISSKSGDQELVQQLEHVHLGVGRPRARSQARPSDNRSPSLELEVWDWDDLEHVWPWLLEDGDGAGPSVDKGVTEPVQKPSVLMEQEVLEDICSGMEDAQEESSEQLPGNIQSRLEELLSEDGPGMETTQEVPKQIMSRSEDQEVVQQLEHVHVIGDVEQSSSEWRQQQPADLFQESLGLDHHSGGGLPRDIPFHLLEEITDDFSNKCKLGSGEDGPRMETQEVAEQISSTSGDQEVVQQLEHVHLGRPRARGQASTSDDRSRSLELEAWDDLEHVWPWLENGDGAGPSEDKGVMEPEQKPSVLTEQVVLEDIGSGTEDAQEESSEQLPGNIQSRPEELLSEEVPKKISSRLEDREVVKQLERVQFNGDIEQSSSEWRQQQHEEDLFQESLDMDHHSGGGLPRDIPFHLLQEITNGFSKERKLGSGAFGEVYMVRLFVKRSNRPYKIGTQSDNILKTTNTAHYIYNRLFTLPLNS